MKKRMGLILCMSGTLLLMKPNLDVEEITMLLNYLFAHYWPLGLVIIGVNLMNQKQKPRRNKN